MHASMYVQIWVAVDRQFGCKDFRASETTALHWPVCNTTFATGLDEEIVVHHLIAVGVPWKALEPASCTRCTQPVGGEITGRFPSLFEKKTAWNLQSAPGMTGMSTFEGYFKKSPGTTS